VLLDIVTDIVGAQAEMTVSGRVQSCRHLHGSKRQGGRRNPKRPARRQRQDHQKRIYSRPHVKVLLDDGHRFFLHELRHFELR
jgi:hypothetical protein